MLHNLADDRQLNKQSVIVYGLLMTRPTLFIAIFITVYLCPAELNTISAGTVWTPLHWLPQENGAM